MGVARGRNRSQMVRTGYGQCGLDRRSLSSMCSVSPGLLTLSALGLTMQAENPREIIGGNSPPIEAIPLAADPMDALRLFLKANPVLSTEDEARDAKAVFDAAVSALRRVEAERKGKVDPLNAQVKEINAYYHQWHNASGKPGLWDKLLTEMRGRLTDYAKAEERKRFEAEEAARRAAEEAATEARRAAEIAAEARDMAAEGVCDIDLAAAIEDEHSTSQTAIRAMITARRAEGQTHVRIAGGSRNAMSLRDHETLIVTDWRAAIDEMCDDSGNPPQGIADAILKCARAYRKVFDDLPAGISISTERSL